MTDKEVSATELVSIVITPAEAESDAFDEQLPDTEPTSSVVEGISGEVSQLGPETLTPAEMGIETETKHRSVSGMELETRIDAELESQCESEELKADTFTGGAANVSRPRQSLGACSLSPTEYEEMTRDRKREIRQKWCEVLILIAVIVVIWVLMLSPVQFYHILLSVSCLYV